MKKILVLLFILFCAVIFHQIILGKNGLIEGYKIRQEKSVRSKYLFLLRNEKSKLESYIDHLKNDTDIYEELANELGFFSEDVRMIKFYNTGGIRDILSVNNADIYYERYLKDDTDYQRIEIISILISIVFYLFFLFFVILLFLTGKRDGESY